METVIDEQTWVLFEYQNKKSLTDAIVKFKEMHFNSITIREHALKFSKQRFENEIKEFVDSKYLLFKGGINKYFVFLLIFFQDINSSNIFNEE